MNPHDIIILMINLSKVGDVREVKRLFLESMGALLSSEDIRFEEDLSNADEFSDHVFPLKTLKGIYGYVVVGKDLAISDEEISLLLTSCQLLAVVIENNLQGEENFRRYEAIVSGSRDAFALIDRDLVCLTCNDVYAKKFNKSRDEVEGKHISNIYDAEFFESVAKPQLQKVMSGEDLSYYDWVDYPTGRMFVDVVLSPYYGNNGEILGAIVCSRDSTDRKRAEAKADAHQEFADHLINSMQETIYIFDPKTGMPVKWNKANSEISGYTDEEIGSMVAIEGWYDDDKLKASKAVKETLKKGQSSAEILLLKKDGSSVPIEYRTFLIKDPSDGRKLVVAVGRDISDKKKSEQDIFDIAKFPSENPNLVMRITSDGIVSYSNGASQDLLKQWKHKKGKPLRGQWFDLVKETIASGKPAVVEVECGEKSLSLSYSPVAGEDYVNVYSSDITDRKRMEIDLEESNRRLLATMDELKRAQKQFVQQERLSALGQMASGITHDFNNMLMPILGLSDFLANNPEMLKDVQETREILDIIRSSAADAAGVVKRLREFYKPDEKLQTEPVDVKALLNDVIDASKHAWKTQSEIKEKHIKVRTDVSRMKPVMLNRTEIKEAMTNLVFNAVDAMPEGGILTVSGKRDEDTITLAIEDTGNGMSADVVRQCMEPFFSTKGEHGTGMGLAMVHGIASRHGGKMEVDSVPGEGTVIRLILPVVLPERTGRTHKAKVGEARKLSVLVVDDDVRVREVVARYLASEGHAVVRVESVEEALSVFDPDSFDLVITDRAMPNASGDVLAAKVKEMSPETLVFLLTGFGDMMLDGNEHPQGVDLIISKPITVGQIRDVILQACEMLDGSL